MKIDIPGKTLKQITKLDLSNKNLKSIPKDVFLCTNLTKLILCDNNIREIPKEISLLQKLKVLDLSNNKINVLYADIFRIPKLITLNVANNNLKTIPRQISESRIKNIFLQNNQITKVFEEQISKIVNLNISHNQIEEFSVNKFDSKLKHIWISDNPIKKISLNWVYLHNIKSIYAYSKMKEADYSSDYLKLSSKKGNSINVLKSIFKQKELITNHLVDNPKPVDILPINNKKNPKVFISYSWDSEEHKNFVFSLSEKLRGLGYNSDIDRYHKYPNRGWSNWANDQMEEADVIIVFITPEYIEYSNNNKKNDGKGEGASWESTLLTQFIEKISKGYIKKKIIIALYKDFEISKLKSIYSIPPRVILPESFNDLIDIIESDEDDSDLNEINNISLKEYLKNKFPTLKLESQTGIINDFPRIFNKYGYTTFTQLDELLRVTEIARESFREEDTFGNSAAREIFVGLGLVNNKAETEFLHEEDFASLRVNRKYVIN